MRWRGSDQCSCCRWHLEWSSSWQDAICGLKQGQKLPISSSRHVWGRGHKYLGEIFSNKCTHSHTIELLPFNKYLVLHVFLTIKIRVFLKSLSDQISTSLLSPIRFHYYLTSKMSALHWHLHNQNFRLFLQENNLKLCLNSWIFILLFMLASLHQTLCPGAGLLRELASPSSEEQMQICKKDHDLENDTTIKWSTMHLASYRLFS